jgi:hypothetical protein
LMNFSQGSMRGAEIWHIWKQHHLILGFPYDDFSLYPCDFSTPTL